MALRSHVPLLPIVVYNDGLGRWRLVFHPPVQSGEKRPTAEGLTAALNIEVEKIIRRAPENWFWVHDRWKTPDPDFLLSGYRRGIRYAEGYDLKQLQPFRVLLRSPNWLGDACMVLPAVRALKAGRPDLSITVLAPDKLGDFWSSMPEVAGVILKQGKEGIGSVARRIREAGPFDAAILLTNSTRSTLEIWWAGVPRLVGYRGSLRSWFLHQVVREPKPGRPPEHHAQRYLRIIERCGGAVDPALLAETAPPSEGAESWRIALCAGAEYGRAKRWPLERYAEAARKVSESLPEVEWLLVGAPKEKPMGLELSAVLGSVRHRNVVGQTSLPELMALLKSCRLLLTNDTGTMHLAAALGVPTLSIFGSTEPVLTGPLGSKHIILRHHVPCSPCFQRECPFGHYDCMTGISPERVANEVLRALGPPAPVED